MEAISFGIISFLSISLRNNSSHLANMKNLIQNVHQNFLVLIEFILSRLSPETQQNMWAYNLKNILK